MYIPADGAKRPNILLRVDEPHLRQLGQLRRVQLLRRNCIVRNTTFNQSDPAHSRLTYVNHKRQRLPLAQTPPTPCAIDTPHLDGYNSSRSILLEGLGDVPSGLAGPVLPSPPNMFSKASMFIPGAPPRPPPAPPMFLHNGATQGYNCRNSFLTIHNRHEVSQTNEVNTSNARVQTSPTAINTQSKSPIATHSPITFPAASPRCTSSNRSENLLPSRLPPALAHHRLLELHQLLHRTSNHLISVTRAIACISQSIHQTGAQRSISNPSVASVKLLLPDSRKAWSRNEARTCRLSGLLICRMKSGLCIMSLNWGF